MSETAWVFPGQGSQSVGMMSAQSAEFPVVRETFEEASEVLGYDLWQLVEHGPADRLDETEITQPAMLAAGVATWRCLAALDAPRPDWLAGHSLGEYSALVCAGALTFRDAVTLVAFRGRAMKEAVPPGEGAMAAVLGLDDEAVKTLCVQAAGEDVVEAVNFNAPGQVVIAGNREAVARACGLAREAGARRCVELPVSVPSHCALMVGAGERLRAKLLETEIRAPAIPVVHNTDVRTRDDADEIRAALVRQLSSPVRWVETISWLRDQGVSTVIECGPGKVLAGLNRRIDRQLRTLTLSDAASIHAAAGGEREQE